MFSFPCSADHERDWPPCKVVFFGLATNTLNVRNNNNIDDVRHDAGSVFDYTSYFVTVGLTNKVQLRLLGNYPGMLELLESLLLCYLVGHLFSSSLCFPDVMCAKPYRIRPMQR